MSFVHFLIKAFSLVGSKIYGLIFIPDNFAWLRAKFMPTPLLLFCGVAFELRSSLWSGLSKIPTSRRVVLKAGIWQSKYVYFLKIEDLRKISRILTMDPTPQFKKCTFVLTRIRIFWEKVDRKPKLCLKTAREFPDTALSLSILLLRSCLSFDFKYVGIYFY